MDIKDKIIQIIEYKKMSRNSFEKSIGVSKSYLANTKSISADVLANVCLVYSDISAEWLLRNEGTMIKSASEIVSEDNITLDIDMDAKDVVIKALTEKIQRLESEIVELRRKYEPQKERSIV